EVRGHRRRGGCAVAVAGGGRRRRLGRLGGLGGLGRGLVGRGGRLGALAGQGAARSGDQPVDLHAGDRLVLEQRPCDEVQGGAVLGEQLAAALLAGAQDALDLVVD